MDRYKMFANPAIQKLRRASSNVEILKTLDTYRWLSTAMRITLTAALVSWGIFLSDRYYKSRNQEQIQNLEKINLLWIGKDPNGLLFLIAKIWILTIATTAIMSILSRFNAL